MGNQQTYSFTEDDPKFVPVREDLLKIMNSPEWDDGSYAPLLIRLAWHSSGTYSAFDGTGGSNGATMRYTQEANDPENAGLDFARKFLEPVKAKHPWVSYADLWVLASYVAIEHTAGPKIPFHGGRVDAPERDTPPNGRLPAAEYGLEDGFKLDAEGRFLGWENLAAYVRNDIFGRMGFDDKEIVALLSGGHVYGRCHTEHSGYAGAWVENPTRFSNEYAADMVGDEWIAVTEDTKMPDGGEVPEEVRPKAGKRQYIDMTKYSPPEEDKEQVTAPDAKDFPPGRYVCVSDWVNARETYDVSSDIVGRFNKDEEIQMLSVKLFGTAMRARTERGGWVSIKASGGKTLFERKGDFDFQALVGKYRVIASGGAPVHSKSATNSQKVREMKAGTEFSVSKVVTAADNNHTLFGCVDDAWVLIHSPEKGALADLIVTGYNEKPRKAIKGQTGHQMMLASDMILLWDSKFRVHLEKYAEDQDALMEDFGKAFKRLTELGCPWSKDSHVKSPGSCPFICTVAH